MPRDSFQYTTRHEAEREAARRFGSAWPRVPELFEEMVGESWMNRIRDGYARAATALPALDRAARALRKAEAIADETATIWTAAVQDEVDMPGSFFSLGELAEQVERAAAEAKDALPATPRRSGEQLGKAWLVRAASKEGIRARAAAWCFAFLALGFASDPPIRPSRNAAYAWSKRVAGFSKDARKLRLPIVR